MGRTIGIWNRRKVRGLLTGLPLDGFCVWGRYPESRRGGLRRAVVVDAAEGGGRARSSSLQGGPLARFGKRPILR